MAYSSLFLSVLNLSAKVCIGALGVVETTFLRCFTPLVLLIPILGWKGKLHELRMSIGFHMHLLRSLCVVLGQTSLSYYLTQGTIANATMLWATGPIYIPILSFFFFRHKTLWVTWFSIAICLLGVMLMIKPTNGLFDPFSIWGIFAGILTAFSQILWGHNVEKGSLTENFFYLYLFSSVLALFTWIYFGNQGLEKFPDTTIVWVAIVGLGLASLGNQLFRSRAYQKAAPYLLTPILYTSVVGGGILDAIFYRRFPDLWGYIGFGLVLAGTLIKWWYLKKMGEKLN